jgi:hypothetical protein
MSAQGRGVSMRLYTEITLSLITAIYIFMAFKLITLVFG